MARPAPRPEPQQQVKPQEQPKQAGGKDADQAQQMEMLAKVLDDIVTLPGTNFGVGLDGLLGLVPGVGDTVTTTLATTILVDAVRRRVPIPVLLKMAWHLLVDTMLGWVPLVGDAADFAHRANRKNYRLLRQAIESGERVDDSYPAYMVKAVGVVVGVLVLMVASAIFAIWATITILVHLLG
ncbi:DUF4112 domain-containing protein [Propionibacteriaceae bacterium Y1923]|uniref:DUF4112 domain-containing protein n=1 Tax=Aestuariimicrobium sp. Y1814 TaxID=3418742 RepID=UPI003C1D8419